MPIYKLQIAGTVGGLKIMEIRRLAARGHMVTVIGERQFWRLVGGAERRGRTGVGEDGRTGGRGLRS